MALSPPKPKVPGLVKGLAVTLKTMLTPAVTRQYPHEKPELAPRTRGVIALMEENCTVCMMCARECPDWCIYIDSHKETVAPTKEGGRSRTYNVLDRFAIDFALCMYCGICVEVCPFDALFWTPEFEYSTYSISDLLHERPRLRQWMDTVPPPPPLEDGAVQPDELSSALDKVAKEREAAMAALAAEQATDRTATAGDATDEGAADDDEDIEVEAQVDEEIYQALLAEGKSDRVARARAKAAYVRREKARIRAQRAEERKAAAAQQPAAPPAAVATQQAEAPAAAPAPAPVEEDIHVEAEIDEETYNQLIAEGKGERVARARAKAAYVRKEKARIRAERAQGDGQPEGDK